MSQQKNAPHASEELTEYLLAIAGPRRRRISAELVRQELHVSDSKRR